MSWRTTITKRFFEVFKPITETQKATREITEGLKPIKEGIENLPQAIMSIQAIEKLLEGEDTQFIGEV